MRETWIVTDGAVGMEAQGIAVAEAVGLPYTLKRVKPAGLMRLIPIRFQHLVPAERRIAASESSSPLAPPWPRLVISIGRRSVPLALAIKWVGGAYGLHIQNPKGPAHLFDLIAAPVHDDFEAPNVISTFGAVHSVTAARLNEAGARFAPQIADLPHPRIAVLLGGESRAFSFPPEVGARFGDRLAKLARECRGTLLITPSRRTGPDTLSAVAEAVNDVPHIIWDGRGENPYFAFLSLADAIVVTEDSVNMVTEATGTGKPVYIQPLPGRSSRLARFHALMRERGATRPFEGRIDPFDYAPVNDTEAVAAPIRKALGIESTE
ncbi:MAG: mitochondrial fission ELM1 family protein [Methyloceanibacter sp.]|jgi:mitochondrial fission protein ELM1|uniref:mitochondrial fission ELM1 family protein n=1 Tax=Methyloceanibacter sp. TaxID=1965321 RepID=UPI003C541C73